MMTNTKSKTKLKFSIRFFILVFGLISIPLGLFSMHLIRLENQIEAASFLREHGCTTLTREYAVLLGYSYDGKKSTLLWPGMDRNTPGTFTILNPHKVTDIAGDPEPPREPQGWIDHTFGTNISHKEKVAWIGSSCDLSIEEIVNNLRKLQWLEHVVLECTMNVNYRKDGSFEDNSTCILSEQDITMLKKKFRRVKITKSLWYNPVND